MGDSRGRGTYWRLKEGNYRGWVWSQLTVEAGSERRPPKLRWATRPSFIDYPYIRVTV